MECNDNIGLNPVLSRRMDSLWGIVMVLTLLLFFFFGLRPVLL